MNSGGETRSAAAAAEAEAVELFLKSDFARSTEVLLTANAEHGETSFRNFCIGRNFRHERQLPLAFLWFRKAARQRPVFPWVWYELAAGAFETDRVPQAGEDLKRFLETQLACDPPPALNDCQRELISAIANATFNADRNLGVELYQLGHRIGVATYLSRLRVAEEAIARHDAATARKLFNDLLARFEVCTWGRLTEGRLLQLEGDLKAARDATITAIMGSADELACIAGCHRLVDLGCVSEATMYLEKLAGSHNTGMDAAGKKLRDLAFRVAAHLRDFALLAKVVEAGGWPNQIEDWVLAHVLSEIDGAQERRSAGKTAVVDAIVYGMESARPLRLPVVQALLQHYARSGAREKTARLFEEIADTRFAQNRHVVLSRFEFLCAGGDLECAQTLYETHYLHRDLDSPEAAAILRFLAERKMWMQAANLVRQMISAGFVFEGFERLTLQIARRTATRQDILNLLTRERGKRDAAVDAALGRLQQLLIDDLCVIRGRQDLESGGDVRRNISQRNSVLTKPSAVWGDDGTKLQLAVYLCVDRAYFFSALTFLASYVVHNAHLLRRAGHFVFLASDVPAEWEETVRRVCGFGNGSIAIIREAEFVPSGTQHKEEYGLFAGGNRLSSAAYFRIYAARFLYALGHFRRAAYIDSDIVCQDSLEDFLRLDFGNAALLARMEEPSPEVAKAAARNGLAVETYFNSGVLQFNFDDPYTITMLNCAAKLSETEPERLVFHDQCALNIAFRNRVVGLPEKYNFFLRPHRTDNGDHRSAALIHYLDRPKPWDVSFVRDYRSAWEPFALIVRTLLSPEQYNDIVAAANGSLDKSLRRRSLPKTRPAQDDSPERHVVQVRPQEKIRRKKAATEQAAARHSVSSRRSR